MKRYAFCFLLGIAAALSLNERTHLILFPAALLAVAMVEHRAYRIFRHWKLWFFFIFILLIPVLLVPPKDAAWLGAAYNSRMLRLNFIMVERSVLIMLSIRLFTTHISLDHLSHGLTQIGLVQFERVFRLAMELLPQIRMAATDTFKELPLKTLLKRPTLLLNLASRLVAQIIFQAHRQGAVSRTGEENNP